MDNESSGVKQIKALNVYYEVSQKEYDDSHKYYDAIDNKVNTFFALSVAVPTLLFSWIKLHVGLNVPFISACFGFASLIGVFVFVFFALRVRTVKFGAGHNEFQVACKNYDDAAIRESIADKWLASADTNYVLADDKAHRLKSLQWFFFIEMLFFISAVIGSFC